MNDRELIDKSIRHWRKMIHWVVDQDPNAEVCTYDMISGIGQFWGADHCDLCREYLEGKCVDCPLYHDGNCCNDSDSVWIKVESSETWGEWLTHAIKMLQILELL